MDSPEKTPPKLIRLRDAFAYLGMDKNCFNREVRPYLTKIPIGKQGIAFDRLDLDAWAECTKQRAEHPEGSNLNRIQTWDKKNARPLQTQGYLAH